MWWRGLCKFAHILNIPSQGSSQEKHTTACSLALLLLPCVSLRTCSPWCRPFVPPPRQPSSVCNGPCFTLSVALGGPEKMEGRDQGKSHTHFIEWGLIPLNLWPEVCWHGGSAGLSPSTDRHPDPHPSLLLSSTTSLRAQLHSACRKQPWPQLPYRAHRTAPLSICHHYPLRRGVKYHTGFLMSVLHQKRHFIELQICFT